MKEFEHPQYQKVEGRPLVIFAKGFSKEETAKAVKRLREVEGGVFLVCDAMEWGPQLVDKNWVLEHFDGATNSDFVVSSPPEFGGYGITSRSLRVIIEEVFKFKEALPPGVSFVPTVIPGFNERGESPESQRNVIPRKWSLSPKAGTYFYMALTRYAGPSLEVKSPLVFVRSWNDWGEDSAIEPLELASPTSRDVEGGVLCGGFKYEGFVYKYLAQLRDSTVSVSGRVVSPDGVPLADIPVTAWKDRDEVLQVRSNQAGYFRFPRGELKAGLYQVGLLPGAGVDLLIKPERSVTRLRFVTEQPAASKPARLSLDPKLTTLSKGRDFSLEPRVKKVSRKIGAFEWTGPPGSKVEPLPRSVLKHLDPRQSVFEVGASSGEQSLQLAGLVRSGASVYSAESDLGRYRFLKANATANPESGIKPMFYSLGERLGTSPDGWGGLVERRSLDSFALADLGLVWLKVRGQTLSILSGARDTLKRTASPIVFPGDESFDEVSGLLVGYGYEWLKADGNSWVALPLGTGDDRFRLAVGEGFHTLASTGFFEPEYDLGVSFVWSDGKTSEIQVPLSAPGQENYRLALRARSLPSLAPLTVEVALNERALGTLTLGKDWQGHMLQVPKGLLKAGPNALRFDYPKARRPTSSDSDRGDARELAMALSAFWLAPGH